MPPVGQLGVGVAVGITSALFLPVPVAMWMVLAVVSAQAFFVARKLNRRNATAVGLLNERKFDVAENELRSIAAVSRRARRSLVLHNIAVCFLRTGRIEEALSVLCELEASKATRQFAMRRFRSSIQYTIANAYLQLGHLNAADSWSEAAKKSPANDAVKNHLLFDGLRLVRCQQYVDGDRFFQEHFRAIEGFTPGVVLRGWRVRHAFAAHRAGAPEERVQQLLAAGKPCEPGEYAPLAVGWPEFHAFLVEQGL
jgi:tetratricopeptide (TPR) repeat protein